MSQPGTADQPVEMSTPGVHALSRVLSFEADRFAAAARQAVRMLRDEGDVPCFGGDPRYVPARQAMARHAEAGESAEALARDVLDDLAQLSRTTRVLTDRFADQDALNAATVADVRAAIGASSDAGDGDGP